jgi:hypothetical protein
MRIRPIDKIYTDKPEWKQLYDRLNEAIEQVNMLTRTVQVQNETIRNLQHTK